MKIVQVTTTQHYRYIPLKGWQSLEAAVDTYDQGFTKGAKATETKQVRAIGQGHGGLGVGLFLLAATAMGSRSKLVKRMLAEAKVTLQNEDRSHHSYDYDARGTTFFKTSVDLVVLDRQADLYGLGIYAAYVGDKPEEELAEHLGIPRCLIWSSVISQTKPLAGDRFAFDFESIVRRLEPILGTHKVSGTDVAAAMMETKPYGSPTGFTLFQKKGVHVSINPSRVRSRFEWHDPHGPGSKQIDTWKVEGATLYGLLDESYEDRKKKDPPSFAISLSEDRPTWQPNRKKRILTLTQQIADALR